MIGPQLFKNVTSFLAQIIFLLMYLLCKITLFFLLQSTMQQLPIPQQQFSMMQPQQQQQKRPDLSAFDSLLTMNTNSNRTPMNSMMGQQQQLNSNSNWGMTQQNLQQQQPWLRPQQPSVVKSLTENDISDLLS